MASRFWVGGTGSWTSSNTANWSATSGGASGASVPGAADTVTFDTNSGTGTVTTNYSPTIISLTLNNVNITLTLGANLSCSGSTTLSTGTLNLNDKTLSCFSFISSAVTTRVIAFGTGNITLTGNGGNIWSCATGTNMTVTGTPIINATYSGATGTRRFDMPALGEFNSISLNVTAGTDTIDLRSTNGAYKNLNFTGFSGSALVNATIFIYGNLTTSSGMTWFASTASIFFAATSGIQQLTTAGKTLDFSISQNNPGSTLQLQDNLTMGSTRTFTFTAGDLHINNRTLSTGIFSSSNSNVRVIDFKSGNITTTGSGTVWTTATTTNFSYLGTPTVNISNNSATATTVSTGAMTAAQALNFNYTTGTYTLTDTAAVYKTVNFTGFAGTIPNSVRTIHGGATFSAGMTLTAGANVTTFAATSGTNNITTAAKTLDFPITFNGIGGTWAFQDALTQGATRAFTITNGTVQLKSSATSTTGAFATSGTTQKFLQSTTPGTQATLTQASGTVNSSYLTIQDINAIGGATWSAPISQFNVDGGNNDGWDFFVQLGQYMYTRRKNKRLLINY